MFQLWFGGKADEVPGMREVMFTVGDTDNTHIKDEWERLFQRMVSAAEKRTRVKC